MLKYIEREPIIAEMQNLIDNVSYNYPYASPEELESLRERYETVIEYVQEQPTVDIPLVKHGKWLNLHAIWISQDNIEGWFLQAQCSNCLRWAHKLNPYTHEFEYKFCPSCNSEMLSDTDAANN